MCLSNGTYYEERSTRYVANEFRNKHARFLEIIDQDSRATFVCLSSSDTVIGARSYSLKECLRGEHGVCEHSGQYCPESDYCRAKKK